MKVGIVGNMTKLEEMKKCCQPSEVSKDWLISENERLYEENMKMRVIIDLLIEELYRRPKQDD